MKKKTIHLSASPGKRRRARELREIPALKKERPMMAELYRRAKTRLEEWEVNRQAKPKAGIPSAGNDSERLLNELQVHQIELEIQNAELQDARNRLEAQLEKYTDLYDFAPVGYFSLDEQGQILETNLAGAALLGVERSQLIKRRLPHHLTAASQPVFWAFLRRIFAGTRKQECEAALVKGDSTVFWGSFSGICSLSASSPRKWCRVAVSDITPLKQAEEMLRQNEALLSALLDQAPIGVFVVDDKLLLQQVNPKAQPVFSNVHPLIGRKLSEIVRILWPRKVADETVKHFRQTLNTGKPYYAPDFSERRRDSGVHENYEFQLQRIILPSGERRVVCFFNDLTERKLAEAAQRRVEVLAASNRKLEQEIIQRHAVEKALTESEQHARGLLEQSRHMQEQLRHLSRQVLSAQEEERKRISRELHDVIAQTLTSINLRLATLKLDASVSSKGLAQNITRTQKLVEHSVGVVHRFARELRPTVLDDLGLVPALHSFLKGYREQTGIHVSLTAFATVEQVNGETRTVLFRIAQEALTNVARHARATRVEITIQKTDAAVCLKIKDNGRGFAAERVSQEKKANRLGLLGMRERVEMVHGTFTAESAPGKGTTICAQIPFATPKKGAQSRSKV